MTETQWFTVAVVAFQFLLSIVLALGAFILRSVVSDLKEVTRDLQKFQREFLQNGVMREQFEEYRREQRLRVHNLADRLGAIEGAFHLLTHIDFKKIFKGAGDDPG